MSEWQIDPEGVSAVLKDVTTGQEDLANGFTEEAFASCVAGLDWGGGVTSSIPQALGNVFDVQKANLQKIGNRISAGAVGVGNAVIAYDRGQEEMVGNFQREIVPAAESGDLTYFERNGYR